MLPELIVFLFALLLRLLPLRLAPGGLGVDQWFWRAYIDAARRQSAFPPHLPQFRLDAAQWYPPLFPWLMIKLPAAVFERYAGLVAISLDLVRLLLLMGATYHLSGSDAAAAAAGIVYALTPLLTTYNMQLNPRGLGALFLDACWLCVLAGMVLNGNALLMIPAVLFAALVLITHKMTTQLMAFLAVVMAIVFGHSILIIAMLAALLVALLISFGFYRFVIIAHWDILRFWYRNWQWSGSNPVLESPIYGRPGFESLGKYYRSGWQAWIRRLAFVIGFNPWMPIAILIGAFLLTQEIDTSPTVEWVFVWFVATFSFGLLTTLVPVFRCLGQGYLYGYNAAFPAAMLFGIGFGRIDSLYWWVGMLCGIAMSLTALLAFFRGLKSSRTMKVDQNLELAIARLTSLPNGTVMCLPQHWHDLVAYRTKKPVAFGGHGYGFSLMQEIFPIIRVRIGEFIERHDIRYLLIWNDYVNDKFIKDLPAADTEKFGDYILYIFVVADMADN